jgi:uncharacterized protein (TIGR03382 family)
MNIRKLLAAATMALVSTSAAQAATLDFTSLTPGYQGTTTVSIPGAEIVSFGDDIFIYGASSLVGPDGGFCAIAGATCEADAEVTFTSGPVSNLQFVTTGYDAGDMVTAAVFSGSTLLSSALVTSAATVSFAGVNGITTLSLDDESTGAGFRYSGFSFLAEVPAPPALPLVLAGLVVLAARRRR